MFKEMKKIGTIDLTPTWQEILPTWKLIVDDATRVRKPDQMDRFWPEMQSMAESADAYTFLLEQLRSEGWNDDDIRLALNSGKSKLMERRRTIKPVEAS